MFSRIEIERMIEVLREWNKNASKRLEEQAKDFIEKYKEYL